MPSTNYRRRQSPCSRCGDVVLITERKLGSLLGRPMTEKPRISLEHADPGPNGEVFDDVDDGCRRPPVR